MHDFLSHDDVTLVAAKLCQKCCVLHVTQTTMAIVLPSFDPDRYRPDH